MKKLIVMIVLAVFTLSLTACDTATDLTDDLTQIVNARGRTYDNIITAKVGETTNNVFFEWTVSSVWVSYDIDGYTPPDGYMYVAADIITTNTTYDNNLPLGNSDYIIVWGPEEDGWDYPLDEFTEGMYPDEVTVEVGKTVEGLLVFLVPDDVQDVSIIYDEIYDDDFVGNSYSYDITLSDHQSSIAV